MKSLYVSLDDNEHAALVAVKKRASIQAGRRLSWKEFILWQSGVIQ